MRTLLALLLFPAAAFADQTLPGSAPSDDEIEVHGIAARGPLAFQSAISLNSHAGCSRGYSDRTSTGNVALTVGGDNSAKLVVDTDTVHRHGAFVPDPQSNIMKHTGGTETSSEHQVWSGRARRKRDTLVLDLRREGEPRPAPFPNTIHIECRPGAVLVGELDTKAPMQLLRCPLEQLKDPSDPLVRLSSDGGVALGGAKGIQLTTADRGFNGNEVQVTRRPLTANGTFAAPKRVDAPMFVGL